MRYFESKQETYINNKPKLYTLTGEELTPLVPIKSPHKNGAISYYLSRQGNPKKVNEEVLEKYFTEITRSDFFCKETINTPIW